MKIKFKILLISLFIVLFVNSVQASWIPDSDFKDGIDGGVGWPSPVIGYNITGDDKWTLIYGDMFGDNYGFYWNGNSWVPDQSRVLGITNHGALFVYSSTSLGYNVTGNDNWEIIFGYGSGTFAGYYWNGSSWVEDSDIVNGLADVGDRAAPALAYNVTGNGNWVLLAGEFKIEGDTEIVGYQFESGSWTAYNDITVGLPNIEHISKPHFAYNLTGNDNWNLIICDDSGAAFGYYWSGSSWISNSDIISGLSGIGIFPNVVTNYDIRNDENWTLISGNADDNFFAYYFNVNPVTSSLQTESQTNPTEVMTNVSNPYFSWTYFDSDNGPQYSYTIKVGTSEGLSDMWNSDEVISSNNYANYDGSSLEEVKTYYVQIRTSDSYDDSSWVLGTFKLKDSTVYTQPSKGDLESVVSVEREEIIEKIEPETLTERIINILPETDSMIFVIYFVAATLGSLIFAVIASEDKIIDIIFSGAVGWLITLIIVFINNLYSIIDMDTILTMLVSIISGFVVYGLYNYFEQNKK